MKLDDIFILPPWFSIEKSGDCYGDCYSPIHNGKYISYSGYYTEKTIYCKVDAIKVCWEHFKKRWFS